MDLLLSLIPGLAIAAGLCFIYLVATKGLPAALAWVKARWNAGRAELDRFDGEIGTLFDRVVALEKQMVSVLSKGSPVAPNAVPAAPAPAPQPDAAPQQQA